MLQSSETSVVTLSEGKFGREDGLAKQVGSAPLPTCTRSVPHQHQRTHPRCAEKNAAEICFYVQPAPQTQDTGLQSASPGL